MPTWIHSWLERHQHPASRVLHLIGIPLLVFAAMVTAWQLSEGVWSLWWRPVILMVISFLLQGVGHMIVGNDMGEVILIKKLMGRSYMAVAPRYQSLSRAAKEKTPEPFNK